MASTISAGTSAGTAIAIAGDTTGNLAFTTQAGTYTQTLPNATGTVMVSGNMPAFSAYKSAGAGAQSVTANVATKITYDTKEYDTNSNFASSRFTPTVAGYYQVTGASNGSNTAYTYMQTTIYKNGSAYKQGASYSQSASYPTSIVSALVYLNGSTDYVELYVTQSATASVLTGIDSTYFQAVMVRSA